VTRDDLIQQLNRIRVEELKSIAQYMRHHYVAEGMKSAAIAALFKKIAMTEMKHAYQLAERVVQLGGEPVAFPRPDQTPSDLREMLAADLEEERVANDAIRSLLKEVGDDVTTRLMLEKILAEGEEHAHELTRLLK
jgi:bacterioferritin